MMQNKQFLFSALQSIFQDHLFDKEVLEKIEQDQYCSDLLNQVLHNHNMAARAYRIHTRSDSINKSLAFWKDLEKAYLASIQSTTTFLSLAEQLNMHFKKRNIQFAFIKGPVLAKRLYDYPYDRVFHDLDLYFPEITPQEVIEELEPLGYVLQNRGMKFYVNKDKLEFFFKGDPKLCVEVHFSLGYEDYKLDPLIFTDPETGFPVLDFEGEFKYLLFHAGVQHRFQKLTWLLDLALYEDKFGPQMIDLFEKLNQSDHVLSRCYRIMSSILNFYNHASPCELPPDWIAALIDEGELSKWQIAALRMKIQGKAPFFKYMFHRFIGKFDHARD